MSTGSKWNKFNGTLLIGVALLWVAAPKVVLASDAQDQQAATPKKVSRAKTATKSHAKAKKPALPPLPSGPTGPVQQVPLDSIAAVPPQVSYENNQLTIVAPNSTLAEILRAVHKQTGAEIEIPSAPERVVTKLGPGPARDVVADLLNGSRFNYVLLGSAGDNAALTRVVLVAKTNSQEIGASAQAPDPALGIPQAGVSMPPQQAEEAPEEAESSDDNADADQAAADAEQQAQPQQDQQGVRTPQQMLQEMQQRQMQLQQAQPGGQPPIPGSGMPPHPPAEQQQQ